MPLPVRSDRGLSPRTPARPLALGLGAGLAAGVAIAGGVLAWRALLAYAGRKGARELMHPEVAPAPSDSLEAHGLSGESVRLATEEGFSLGAWYVPALQPTTQAIALFHGHTAERSQLVRYARFLRERYNCLLVDFRACGDSEGPCSSMGLYEARDVAAAVRWLRARGQTRVGALGISMGGAALLRAAAETPEIACVITEGTFDRVETVIAERARQRRYPAPRAIARAVVAEASRALGADLAHQDPVDFVGRLAPRGVLIVHGAGDTTSPVRCAYRLFAAAKFPKELLVVPEAAHTTSHEVSPAEYERRVMGFLARHMGANGVNPT